MDDRKWMMKRVNIVLRIFYDIIYIQGIIKVKPITCSFTDG